MADENLDPNAIPEPTEDASLDLDLEGGEAEVAKTDPPEPESSAMVQLRQELENERRLRGDIERRLSTQPTPQPTAPSRDPEFDKEEAQLAQYRATGASAEQVSWLEWKIGNDRRMRAMERSTAQAHQSTSDIADRADFARLEAKHPARYKHYAPRVEAILSEARRNGQPILPRMIIYKYLLGDDVDNKVAPPAGKRPASPAAPASTVARGKMPGARSDVNPKDRSGMTEHQKRIERMKAAHDAGKYL